MKPIAYLIFAFLFFSILPFGIAAQETSAKLIPNQNQTFSIRNGEEKRFVVNLKKDDFAEFSWQTNSDSDLKFSLYAPSGRDVFADLYVTDSIPVIVPEDGEYSFVVKLNAPDKSAKVSSEQNIAVRFTNVFKMPAGGVVKSARKINGYDLRIVDTSGDNAHSFLLIEKLGKLKAILKGDHFGAAGFNFSDDLANTYTPAEKRSAALFRAEPDKTGDGTPDAAVDYFSGGAHCCFDLHFFELGASVRHVKPLKTADERTIAIGKNPNGGLRLLTGDTTFTYWNIYFAGSPIPSVILDFQNGEFRPDFEAMKKPAPSPAALQKMARAARAELSGRPYKGDSFAGAGNDGYDFKEPFWSEMLDLIYTGHEDLAWQYFDLVWRADKPGKEIFKRDFKNQLAQSEFWQMIEQKRGS